MIKVLPTTAAIATMCFQPDPGGAVPVRCLWAGDSRIYVLSPTVGLQQLTTDDLTSGGDPLENLKNDSRMSNCISLETPFILHEYHHHIRPPFLLLAATDGCFGYLPSPMHFEFALLDTLSLASSMIEWKDLLTDLFTRVASDDATMSIASLGLGARGFNSFVSFRDSFRSRRDFVGTRYVGPIDVARQNTDGEDFDALRTDLWEEYRSRYLERAPDRAIQEGPR
jgi:hypothetical protein